ncbi:hypothetical protein STEG23_007642 [Scotinomys teguina]
MADNSSKEKSIETKANCDGMKQLGIWYVDQTERMSCGLPVTVVSLDLYNESRLSDSFVFAHPLIGSGHLHGAQFPLFSKHEL